VLDRKGTTMDTTQPTTLDNLLGAASLLALHALASSWVLDTYGDDAEDTAAMEVLWWEAKDLCPTMESWLRAWELSVSLYD